MNSVKYIFGKPDYMDVIGNIYPIKLEDYDDFIECSNHLYINKNHFIENVRELTLLELLIFGLKNEKIISDLEKLFSLALRKQVEFFIKNENKILYEYEYGFISESNQIIHKDNYEQIRNIIMHQNLMFDQKVYKDKIVEKYMYKSLEVKAKNSIKMEFEDMISTVSVFTGKHYWDLEEYTIYQLKSDFNRISKFKNYDTSIAFKCVSTEPIKVEHFAENVDMFKNPYDLDNFTKSKDTINNLDQAMK